jgi:hypothetical protein
MPQQSCIEQIPLGQIGMARVGGRALLIGPQHEMPRLQPGKHLVDPCVDRGAGRGNHRRIFRRTPDEVGDAAEAGGHDVGIPLAENADEVAPEASWYQGG